MLQLVSFLLPGFVILLTAKGGFLLGCMVMAGLLILAQFVVSVAEVRAKAAATEKVKEAATDVQAAAKEVVTAAEKNKQAAEANLEAATTSGASSTPGVAALRMIRDDSGIRDMLRQNQSQAAQFLKLVDLDELDAQQKAGAAKEASDQAQTMAEGATAKAQEAVKEAEGTASSSSFLGALQSVSGKLPLVGGALLFVLIGGLGAGLIKFAVG
jgi:F0F1-type ATP synthase epsilon subunit